MNKLLEQDKRQMEINNMIGYIQLTNDADKGSVRSEDIDKQIEEAIKGLSDMGYELIISSAPVYLYVDSKGKRKYVVEIKTRVFSTITEERK